jgi:hypothetical protein
MVSEDPLLVRVASYLAFAVGVGSLSLPFLAFPVDAMHFTHSSSASLSFVVAFTGALVAATARELVTPLLERRKARLEAFRIATELRTAATIQHHLPVIKPTAAPADSGEAVPQVEAQAQVEALAQTEAVSQAEGATGVARFPPTRAQPRPDAARVQPRAPGAAQGQPALRDWAQSQGLPSLMPPLAPLAPYAARSTSASTQHFAMTMENLALAGLRELASSLVPGVPLETTGDVARLVTKLHDTVEVFCRCFVPLREGFAQFVSSTDLYREASQRSLNRSPEALRVETARDPSTVAAALLDWRSQSYDAPQVVEAIFADLIIHHVAIVEGVMRGVKALLDELSPGNIERALAEENRSAFLGHHRAMWKTYQHRFDEVTNETRTFELVFGPKFAASYREYLARQPKPNS